MNSERYVLSILSLTVEEFTTVLMRQSHSASSFTALLPLMVFLLSFLGAGLYFILTDNALGFYAFSPALATLPAIILAAFLAKSFHQDFVQPFVRGVMNKNVWMMCGIFLLAGAFSALAKSSGGVNATVNFGLSIIPSWFLLPGLFIITAFISTAMGTSVGTIAAVSPIALGLAHSADVYLPLMAGVVLSGAMFGDNLSIISDTSIAATRTQNCKPRDKFKENFMLAVPAALIVIGIYFAVSPVGVLSHWGDYNVLLILPYGVIFVLAILGMNVFVVLLSGIIAAASLGFLLSDYSLQQVGRDVLDGCLSMKDITLLTLAVSGLGVVMEKAGGLEYIRRAMSSIFSRIIQSSTDRHELIKGELAVASLVSVCNLATANNTIAILLSGRTAKVMSENCGISAKRTASLLDVFSCIVQGMIPWGAQLLLLGASFSLSPLMLPLYCFYPLMLCLVTCGFIFTKK